ncbi:MAG: DUF4412 domain-containing protein [Nitrospirae bacterium]|nr:DUF4412 domain-containing protein [Nitrospirota bacterium]
MLRKMLRKILLVFLSVLVFSSVSVGVQAFMTKEYSADLETVTNKDTVTSKVFFKGGKVRMETSARGNEAIMIIRHDKKLTLMLMPDRMIYMEMPLQSKKRDIQAQMHDPDVKTEKDFIGNETIDNHPAKKYHVTFYRDGAKENSGFMWEATDLNNFPVRFQNEDKTSMTTWRNIKMGGVSDDLFEIPAGYKKMDMPMMPQGMDGRGRMPR